MIYYCPKAKIFITASNGAVNSIKSESESAYDSEIEMSPKEAHLYGEIGTRYHYPSGKVSYPTDDGNVMVLEALGYVIIKENVRNQVISLFETPCLLKGKPVIEIMKGLEGDNIGQLAQIVAKGIPVYNSIYETVFSNPFYGCTLSLLPLKGQTEHTVIMPSESSNRYFSDPESVFRSKDIPTETECDKGAFGFDRIKLYTGNIPYLISGFYGFLKYFTQNKVDFIYSYRGKFSDTVCGYDKVIFKKGSP